MPTDMNFDFCDRDALIAEIERLNGIIADNEADAERWRKVVEASNGKDFDWIVDAIGGKHVEDAVKTFNDSLGDP